VWMGKGVRDPRSDKGSEPLPVTIWSRISHSLSSLAKQNHVIRTANTRSIWKRGTFKVSGSNIIKAGVCFGINNIYERRKEFNQNQTSDFRVHTHTHTHTHANGHGESYMHSRHAQNRTVTVVDEPRRGRSDCGLRQQPSSISVWRIPEIAAHGRPTGRQDATGTAAAGFAGIQNLRSHPRVGSIPPPPTHTQHTQYSKKKNCFLSYDGAQM
jgi:hypothetical protein